MNKFQPAIQLYLRIALGGGYLKLGLDRLGFWGPNGSAFVSWGDWKHFMDYASELMGFLPAPLISIFAIIATAAEILFGVLLLAGLWTRFAAIGSGILAFVFAITMAISGGLRDPISYSVFTVSAASFLLATVPFYHWSTDNMLQKK